MALAEWTWERVCERKHDRLNESAVSWFTDLSRLPNRLDLIVAGPVDSGISLYDLYEIKRESMMKIQVILQITAF